MHNLLRQGMDVTEVKRLLYAGGAVVAWRLGLKLGAGKKKVAKKPAPAQPTGKKSLPPKAPRITR